MACLEEIQLLNPVAWNFSDERFWPQPPAGEFVSSLPIQVAVEAILVLLDTRKLSKIPG
jgi:hypothetical protein